MKRSAFRFLAVLPLVLLAAKPALGQESAPDALVRSGDAALAALDNETAAARFEEARELAGDPLPFDLAARLAQTHTYLSLDRIAEGDREAGEAEIGRALEFARYLTDTHPDRAESWFLLAIARGNEATFRGGREKVRIGRAVEDYCLKAIELDPEYAAPHIVLGVFYREVAEVSWVQRLVANTLFGGLPKGSYERSAEFLERAVALDPAIPLAQFELGRTLYHSKREADAVPFLALGAGLEPMSSLDVRNANEARRLLGLAQSCGEGAITADPRARTVAGIPLDVKVASVRSMIGAERVVSGDELPEGEPSPLHRITMCGRTVDRHWNGLSWEDPSIRTPEGVGPRMPVSAFDEAYGEGRPTRSEAGVVVAYPLGERELFAGVPQDCVAPTDDHPPSLSSRDCPVLSVWIPLQTLPE